MAQQSEGARCPLCFPSGWSPPAAFPTPSAVGKAVARHQGLRYMVRSSAPGMTALGPLIQDTQVLERPSLWALCRAERGHPRLASHLSRARRASANPRARRLFALSTAIHSSIADLTAHQGARARWVSAPRRARAQSARAVRNHATLRTMAAA